MHIYSIYDNEFQEYGRILEGLDSRSIIATLNAVPLPKGVEYLAQDPALQALPVAADVQKLGFGGLPVQLGWCSGHNTRLNCLEYHRCSEINMGAEDLILLLAKQSQIDPEYMLDTSLVKAFRVPAGVFVDIYATTLHYAPCSAAPGAGFRMLVVLPLGTNTPVEKHTATTKEDALLAGCNKWLLAHPDSPEAAAGATVGLRGKNIDIADSL